MPHFHRSSCRACGARAAPGFPISATGYCPPCGEERHLEHNRQMKAHAGPWWDHWRRRSLAALGVGLDGQPVGRPAQAAPGGMLDGPQVRR